LNNAKDNLGKFDSKVDEDIFPGYSLHGHAYRAYNRRTMLVEESMHIAFDETNQNMQESPKAGEEDEIPTKQQVDTGLKNKSEEVSKLLEIQSIEPEIQSIEPEIRSIEFGAGADTINSRLPREWRVPKNLSLDNVIGQV